MIWLWVVLLFLVSGVSGFAAKNEKKLLVGTAPGPYSDLFKAAIAPILEKKGYRVELREFSDYVQPNLALANKAIDTNVYQHQPYLEKFAADKGIKIAPVIRIPTVGLGLYSHKIKSLNELKSGDVVTLANDPTNLARALVLLQKHGLVKINPKIEATKASEKDIVENPKKLVFTPIEAAQLPRSLDSVALAAVNGNYAVAAGIPLSSALIKEVLAEEHKIVIAVRTEDLNKPFVQDLKKAVESEFFFKVVEDPKGIFRDFQKPDWYIQKWQKKQ